ncbi:nucleoside phosphorylase (plasmid) [Streptosporangium sp. NBC_01495]|uniref:nucleoside phosphorylase n=1 Tax=Streptosporangium sp. NBC_01495 TaxID=2903899 RepID=UPI002E356F3B|nr:nucleoside phosphorylase [Streptosporangium sp. NBC_01495]
MAFGRPPGPAGYPNLPGKHAYEAVIDPAEHVRYVQARRGATDLRAVRGVVLLYQGSLLRWVLDTQPVRSLTGWVSGDLHLLEHTDHRVGVCGAFGLGAPAAALVTEQLIALGVHRVITVGTAATLRDDVGPGEVVVCRRAVRDDGVSHHYLPPHLYAYPCPALTRHLLEVVRARGLRPRSADGWSIATPYRETRQEVDHYRSQGVLTVDMEATGLFAVAQYRRVHAAAAFVVSDSVAAPLRQPRSDSAATGTALRHLFGAAVAALHTPPSAAGPTWSGSLPQEGRS